MASRRRFAYGVRERVKGAGGFARRGKPTVIGIRSAVRHRRAVCLRTTGSEHGGCMRELPYRPHLEQLKNQAKTLLRDARAGDGAALTRFAVLPAFAAGADPGDLALHDAQSVIAREHGFPSWNAL